jgi:hypothetical protein
METAGTLSSVEFGAQSILFHFRPLISYRSCMEHSLHLAAGHVLSHITPESTEKAHGAGNDNDNDIDDETFAGAASSDDGSAVISNSIRKLLGLITQVRLIHWVHYIP